MITVSSNEATNALVERLGSGNINAGFGVVNSVAAQYGFNESHLNSRMGDLSNYSTKQTSVADQGRFLAAAYRGQLVSAGYSKRMADIMPRQTRRAWRARTKPVRLRAWRTIPRSSTADIRT